MTVTDCNHYIVHLPDHHLSEDDANDKLLTKYGFGHLPEERSENVLANAKKVIYFFPAMIVASTLLKQKTREEFLVSLSLILLGLALKFFCERLCVAFVELFYKKGRYEESGTWKQCFSDFSWMTFAFLSGSGLALYFGLYFSQADKKLDDTGESKIASFMQTHHIFELCGALGIGTFLHHALGLGSVSNVEKCMYDEENEVDPGNTLACQYFYDLEYFLPKLKRANIPSDLSSSKLFILIPLNCNVLPANLKPNQYVTIIGGAHEVREIGVYKIGSFKVMLDFPYSFNTLRKMSKSKFCPAVTPSSTKRRVKLFYRKLKQLLEESLVADEEKKWELVAFNYSALKSDQTDGVKWSGLKGFLENVVLPAHVLDDNDHSNVRNDGRNDGGNGNRGVGGDDGETSNYTDNKCHGDRTDERSGGNDCRNGRTDGAHFNNGERSHSDYGPLPSTDLDSNTRFHSTQESSAEMTTGGQLEDLV